MFYKVTQEHKIIPGFLFVREPNKATDGLVMKRKSISMNK